MMLGLEQLVAHEVGDYLLQSDRMAQQKTSSSKWAAIHAITYALPFLFITRAPAALAAIVVSHFLIDRFRLARYVCWAKNAVGGSYAPWSECSKTGYHESRPDWMAVWLMIRVDNCLHWICNAAAIAWWGSP